MLSERVLVLNQNYEPLAICNAKRAVVLMYLGKAELIERMNGKFIRSVSVKFPFPSVLRLSYYVKIKRRDIPLSRRNVLKRDGYQCQYCGKTTGPMTTDHVVPKDMGGKDVWENLVCACVECNTKKGNRTPAQAGMKLLKKPKRPHYFTFILHNISHTPKEWQPYLFLR